MREGINQRNVKVEGPGECGDSWKERKRLRLDFHESTFQRRNNGVVIRNRRANVSDSSVKCQKQEQVGNLQQPPFPFATCVCQDHT
ncbi:hypothetical protein FF1_001876 [Malus domestica]